MMLNLALHSFEAGREQPPSPQYTYISWFHTIFVVFFMYDKHKMLGL